ncbi:serine/threonine protein kinase [Luteolibacter yonseiensis]|uniref:Serine/threonine protein kinase n=1 Tax=Luteolibacter yonseiensis TaxID=1144680 RepID=A0A934R317_9BACT|nr:serine/threonine-protein kinase [Luteolibacter yonseiensis]MBK1815386.1 serine/threonine protein kinase [Luteolibacter yonseiensis]
MNDDATASGESQFPAEPTVAGWFDLGHRPLAHDEAEHPGVVIGRYRLVAPLGEGGFGSVWQVEQVEPIRRELALKLIKRGMDSREIIARFGAERQALALMDHPNIAAVWDAGTTPDGRPYFAMEWVKGEPLTRYCDSRNLSIRERLELFIPVCHAVQHAHQKAILHRDLKPSNILVSLVDGTPVPKVIDFGIAKALGSPDGADHEASLLRTRAGAVVGTPEYMSPEQAGSVPDVDTRSDIYSLGVILYELLTGQTPLARSGGEVTGGDQLLRRIREEEAAKPSTGFQSVTEKSLDAAACRGSELPRLRRMMKGDLDWIVLKALEKDRGRRYGTATALAADLGRFLRQEPVSAAAPTWNYQFSKLVRRNRTAFTAAGLVGAALVTGTGVSLWQAREAERSRAEAQANYNDAREAVEQYLSRVTENPRLKDANFEPLRKELLETAMRFYEKMERKTGGDPSLLSDRAEAMGRLARINQELGDFGKAEMLFHEAIDIHEKLSRKSPKERSHREALTLHHHNLSDLLTTQARSAEALDAQQRAMEISEQLVKEFPADPAVRFGLMTILLKRTMALSTVLRKDEARRTLSRAMDVGRGLIADVPSEPDYRAQFASCLSTMGGLFHDAGQIGESERVFREAIGIQEKIAAEFPGKREYSSPLGMSCHNLGFLLHHQGRHSDAIVVLQRAVEVDRRIVGEYFSLPAPRDALAGALSILGSALISLERDAEAGAALRESADLYSSLRHDQPTNPQTWYVEGLAKEKLAVVERRENQAGAAVVSLRKAVACQREALRILPENPNYQLALRSHLGGLATTCVDSGNGRAATEALSECAQEPLPIWQDWINLAVLSARNVPVIDSDSSLSGQDKSGCAERCREIAVKALRNACALGYTELWNAAADERFVPLRGYAPFMELEEPAPDPADRSPSRFTFDYPHDDPGKRVWTRSGNRWTEVQPSGKTNVYQIEGRIRLGGVSGTGAVHTVESGMRIFIPDKGSSEPLTLKVKPGESEWIAVGPLGDIE